jgi:hypothetical protein
MFKVDEQVVIKEVHRKYGRSTSTVEMLENIQNQGLIGKVITTDMSDGMLNTYVSFEGAETNIWFNDKELTKYYPFRLLGEGATITSILGEFAKVNNMANELKPIQVEQKNNLEEFDDDMKISLFDYILEELAESKGIDKSDLYEDLMIRYIADYYVDLLIDDTEVIQDRMSRSEIRDVVKYLLIEFSYDFKINIEDMIKKFR